MRAEQIHFPRPSDGKRLVAFDWTPIRYRNVISVLKNPFYAGAYAYGKSEKRTVIVDGRARKTYGHGKPLEAWEVLLKDHHEGYIDWAEFERNQAQLAANAYGRVGGREVGPRWSSAAGWAAVLWALRTPLGGELHRPAAGAARLSMRSAQPDAGTAAMHDLRWFPCRRSDGAGTAPRGGADGDRGGLWKLSGCTRNDETSGGASWSWNCSRLATRLRLRNGATPPAIPTIV